MAMQENIDFEKPHERISEIRMLFTCEKVFALAKVECPNIVEL